MKLFHDIQSLQSPTTKDRGIGKYTYGLANHIYDLSATEDIENFHLLNSSMDIFKNHSLENIKGYSPKIFTSIKSLPAGSEPKVLRDQADEFAREFFISQEKADLIHIHSHFDGYVTNATSSVKEYFNIPTVITLYDLIPFNLKELYLQDKQYADWYYKKLYELTKADAILCISEFSKQSYIKAFGDTGQIIESISSDTDSRFKEIDLAETDWEAIRSSHQITDDYLFCVSGDDKRKNNDRLVEAFALFKKEHKKSQHQLVIACHMGSETEARLRHIATQNGLQNKELLILNYISDEDMLALYNQASGFIFPSLEEGFGLPVLEAMRCGCPVIASNASSLIEVVGNGEFMFNPLDIDSIREKIALLLTNQDYNSAARDNSRRQGKLFSWESSAEKTIEIYKEVNRQSEGSKITSCPISANKSKQTLAWVSPFPPDQSGIADYTQELLLPALNKHFNVTLYADRDLSHGQMPDFVKPVEDLAADYKSFDRVVYNIGNSHFHAKFYNFVRDYPGVVILHDFYIMDLMGHIARRQGYPAHIVEYLNSRGYEVFKEFCETDNHSLIFSSPLSKWVFDHSIGVISHSEYARQLAIEAYGVNQDHIGVMPHPMMPGEKSEIKLDKDEIKIVIFGDVVKGKSILEAVSALQLVNIEKSIQLNIVGKLADKQYIDEIIGAIRKIQNTNISVEMLGRVTDKEYNTLLLDADFAIQLRGSSRGETSGALLRCLCRGLPVISNTGYAQDFHGQEIIYDIGEITVENIAKAIEDLASDEDLRCSLSERAFQYIQEYRSPYSLVESLKAHMDGFYSRDALNLKYNSSIERLSKAIANTDIDSFKVDFANITHCNIQKNACKRVFVDVTELENVDSATGIQRVVKYLVSNLLPHSSGDMEYILVCRKGGRYYTASHAYMNIFGCRWQAPNELIEPNSGDVFFALDLDAAITHEAGQWLSFHKARGMKVILMVYDVLLLKNWKWFVKEFIPIFSHWFDSFMRIADQVCVISKTVGEDVEFYADHFNLQENVTTKVASMGADVFPLELKRKHKDLSNRKARHFLMIGTVEPRKGYEFIIDSFKKFWDEGCEHKLTIVGKKGWASETLLAKLENANNTYSQFQWLNKANDEELISIIEETDALIAASDNEGFGLPIIEMAYLNIPVIVRKIPIFEEVAEGYGNFFKSGDIDSLKAILDGELISIEQTNKNVSTWKESADDLHCYLKEI